MFNSLITSVGMSIVRNGATALSAWLVGQGYLQSSQTDQLLGAILFLASLGFSIFEKVSAHQKIQAASSGQ